MYEEMYEMTSKYTCLVALVHPRIVRSIASAILLDHDAASIRRGCSSASRTGLAAVPPACRFLFLFSFVSKTFIVFFFVSTTPRLQRQIHRLLFFYFLFFSVFDHLLYFFCSENVFFTLGIKRKQRNNKK